jgi:hypothetical protein
MLPQATQKEPGVALHIFLGTSAQKAHEFSKLSETYATLFAEIERRAVIVGIF